MKKKIERAYQFKITLKGIEPPVWRRIQVPETFSFWDLHVAVQDAMGWQDYHLHDFTVINPRTQSKERLGIPDEDDEFELNILADWDYNIADYFPSKNRAAAYVYDYGDNWEHEIKFEKTVPRDKGKKYPRCLAGERACPPEDCGGVYGYREFLEAIMDSGHDRHQELLSWAGPDFEPERYSPKKVLFDDPRQLWKRAFEDPGR